MARLLFESGQVDQALFLEASALALRIGAPDLAGDLAACTASWGVHDRGGLARALGMRDE